MATLDFCITPDAKRRYELINSIAGITHQYVYLMGLDCVDNFKGVNLMKPKKCSCRIQFDIERPVNLLRARISAWMYNFDQTVYETGLRSIEELMALDYAKLQYAEVRKW